MSVMRFCSLGGSTSTAGVADFRRRGDFSSHRPAVAAGTDRWLVVGEYGHSDPGDRVVAACRLDRRDDQPRGIARGTSAPLKVLVAARLRRTRRAPVCQVAMLAVSSI
jgi:hypothetical protein